MKFLALNTIKMSRVRPVFSCELVHLQKFMLLCPIILGLLSTRQANAEAFYHEGQPPVVAQAVVPEVQFPHFSDLVKELSKAVVNISVEGGASSTEATEGQPKREDSPFRSVGSGFIINEQGYIISNNHVIEGASRIIVRMLNDKNEYEATVIGKDPKTDVALIKIEPKKDLPTVFFGDSDALEVGEWVIAIGNQFQLGQTVTAGIVSAKARKLPNLIVGPYDSFIQTDASINPGSSGGPLFNTKGQVVGINTAIYSPGRQQFGGPGFNIGIGFSIPVNLAKDVITQLKESGRVTRGLLGVLIQPVDADIAQVLQLSEARGALVGDVLPDTPASRAGFVKKDVIVSFNGKTIGEHDELPLLVASTPIGKKVAVELIRGGQSKSLSVVVEELKEPAPQKPKQKLKSNSIGLTLEQLAEEEAKALGLGGPGQLVVRAVEADSDAERSGFFKGDVLEEVGGKKITAIEALDDLIKTFEKGKPVLVSVRRKEGSRFLTLKLR
jgi:serine protease Do